MSLPASHGLLLNERFFPILGGIFVNLSVVFSVLNTRVSINIPPFYNKKRERPQEPKIMCLGCFGSSGLRGVGHVPVLLMALMVVTLLLTYVMAVYRRDVSPLFPYISDAGAKQPESSVFGLLLNFGAFLGFLVIYLRYRLVAELNRGSDKILYRSNLIAFVIGVLSTLGMLIVGNFQVTSVSLVHFIGAFMCLGFGLFYQWAQTVVSCLMFPLYNGIRICRIRTFLSVLSTLAFVSCLSTGIAASILYRKMYPNAPSPVHWIMKTDPGYDCHLISAFSEWILIILTATFMLTYSSDFEKLRVFVAVEPLVNHLDDAIAPQPPIDNARLL